MCLYLFLNIGLKAVKGFIAYSNKFSYNRRTVYLGGPQWKENQLF